ncbi:hypothetical protein [Nocardiopsis aegyptia]|uniref:Uncharacterized protein n=1 Tax=Nocardiopsis aegyptia TaxID=220378 RepID=A0A7Z0EI96_9ACTN|nr:hypothetical protein [Nocardiopsis aegyptia]NYJ32564.1 hypothetical protein [Nocardiopsis aegyptia]
MRRPLVLVPVVLLAVVATVSCQAEVNFSIVNELDVPVMHWMDSTTSDQEPPDHFTSDPIPPGEALEISITPEEPPSPWDRWPFTLMDDGCTDSTRQIGAMTEDGRVFMYGPPLCEGDVWVIQEE